MKLYTDNIIRQGFYLLIRFVNYRNVILQGFKWNNKKRARIKIQPRIKSNILWKTVAKVS